MTDAEFANAEWWSWFWGEVEHWSFLLVIVFLAVEFAALKLGAPFKEQLDRTRSDRLATLTVQAETAKSEIAKANARTAEAELQLERLRKQVPPRQIDQHVLIDELKEAPKPTKIFLTWAATSPDAWYVAVQLATIFSAVQWTFEYGEPALPDSPYLHTPPGMSAAGSSGILILFPKGTKGLSFDDLKVGANIFGDKTTSFGALRGAFIKTLGISLTARLDETLLPGEFRIVIFPR